MFDLILGNVTHAPRSKTGPVLVSVAPHAAVVGAVLVGTVMVVTAPVPELPTRLLQRRGSRYVSVGTSRNRR